MSICQGKWIFVTMLWLSFLPFCAGVTTVIDDSDPSIRALTGQWVHFTGDEYYNKTETLTRDAGATSMFIFNGTGISIFGTMCDPAGGNTTVSTYTIDNNGPSTFTVPSGVICNQNFVNFFNSPPLEHGQHTLIITNLNQNAWFFLDYLQVISPDLSSSENTTESASLSSTVASLTSSGISTSLPASSTSTKGTSKAISTGVIVGTAFAAVAFVGILILSVTLWWRRRRQTAPTHKVTTQASEIEQDPEDINAYPIPYHASTFLDTASSAVPTGTASKMSINPSGPVSSHHTSSSHHVSPQSPSDLQMDSTMASNSMAPLSRRPTTSTMPPPYGQQSED